MRGPWAPSTHATASTRFDFPDPFGPTTTVTPGSNSRVVLSANDLNPRTVNDFRTRVRLPFSGLWPQRSDGDLAFHGTPATNWRHQTSHALVC